VKETLNSLWDAEADRQCVSTRYGDRLELEDTSADL